MRERERKRERLRDYDKRKKGDLNKVERNTADIIYIFDSDLV